MSNSTMSAPHCLKGGGGGAGTLLIDTGSIVFTIMESCFVEQFEPWCQNCLRACQWLQLHVVNGSFIPYVGYME